MGKLTVWHGSDVALRNLQNAVSRNCTCPEDLSATCPAHKMLLDQDVLNVDPEFDVTAEWFG